MNRRSLLSTSLLAVLVLSLSLVWSGCENSADITAPGVSETQETPAFTPDNMPQIQSVMRIQDRETPRLMELPDVVGTATGLGDDGQPVIQILTEKAPPPGRLPRGGRRHGARARQGDGAGRPDARQEAYRCMGARCGGLGVVCRGRRHQC